MDLELIGIPFDSYGREGAVSLAPGALRNARLVERLTAAHDVRDAGDLALPAPVAERAGRSGLLNERALIALIGTARRAVLGAHASSRLPILFGGDCAVLLGALPAIRDRYGEAALLFIDGHEDAYPLELSPDGQAADSELSLALGLTGDAAPPEIRGLLPMLSQRRLAALGVRNSNELARSEVGSLRGRVFLRTDRQLADADPEEVVREALSSIGANGAWWLHTDLDVLGVDAFAAHDFPEPGGISWEVLDRIVHVALAAGGCVGWSVVIYNPELDPHSTAAERIVRFIVDGTDAIRAR